MKYSKPYQEQFSRVIRLNENLQKYSIATNENHNEAIDAFTSFFIQCYHVADCLKNSGYHENNIYAFIKKSPYLSLCHALANTQKHQKYHDHSKQKLDAKFCDFGAYDMFGITTPISKHFDYFDGGKIKFCIAASDFAPFPLDVLELTNKCIEEWHLFIEIYSNSSASI